MTLKERAEQCANEWVMGTDVKDHIEEWEMWDDLIERIQYHLNEAKYEGLEQGVKAVQKIADEAGIQLPCNPWE
jgi:hypothetical protein